MYTYVDRPVIHQSLARQMSLIVEETTKTYGKDCTIVLAGGFGRGEGSIKLSDAGQPLPLHDFDLFIITDRSVESDTHAMMEKRILAGLSDLTGTDLVGDGFELGMQVIPKASLARLPPDLSTFEMKAASKILHGPDLRRLIPIEKNQVATASGAITLFHRTIALLKNVEPEYLRFHQYPPYKRLETVYECCKIYTEICTALSLLGGFYEPSYRLRAESFRSNYGRFPELQRALPLLGEKILTYTNMKLRSDFSSIIDRPVETWIDSRRTLEISLSYFLARFLRLRFHGDWKGFCRSAEPRMRLLFFYEYLSFSLSTLGVRASPFVYAANLALQGYDFLAFKRRVQQLGRSPARSLFSLTSPILHIYLASALTLFSLRDDGTIDPESLEASRRHTAEFLHFPKRNASDNESWKQLRDGCVDGQRLYFGISRKKRFL